MFCKQNQNIKKIAHLPCAHNLQTWDQLVPQWIDEVRAKMAYKKHLTGLI